MSLNGRTTSVNIHCTSLLSTTKNLICFVVVVSMLTLTMSYRNCFMTQLNQTKPTIITDCTFKKINKRGKVTFSVLRVRKHRHMLIFFFFRQTVCTVFAQAFRPLDLLHVCYAHSSGQKKKKKANTFRNN